MQVRLGSSAAVSIVCVSVISYSTSRTREVHQLTDLSSLERVLYSSATSEDVRCDCCNGDHLAVRYCSNCKELICLTKVKVNYGLLINTLTLFPFRSSLNGTLCVLLQHHDSYHGSRHSTVSVMVYQEQRQRLRVAFCTQHPEREIERVCSRCDLMICADCQPSDSCLKNSRFTMVLMLTSWQFFSCSIL